jgi:hypothetical protein
MKRKTPPEQTEWIEAYLRGSLFGEELALFKQEMVNDPEFAAEVEFMELTHALLDDIIIEDDVRQIHAQKVQEWKADEEEAQRPAVRPLHAPIQSAEPAEALDNEPTILRPLHAERTSTVPLWGRSAAAAAVAGVALVGYLSLTPVSVGDDIRMATRGEGPATDQSSTLCYDSFYTGKALLTSDQAGEAIPHLERVLTCEVRPYFKDAAKWYLSVAYLNSDQPAQAERLYTEFTKDEDAQYPVKTIDRMKVWWRLRWKKLSN